MLNHKHLLVRAEVNKPIKEEKVLKKWLKDLVKKIDMKIIKGPYVKYIDKEGNKGITGIVAIETSHIAIHIWDEQTPALVQFDVYSCANFSTHEVIMHTAIMEPIKVEHLLIDRGKKFDLGNINKWSGLRQVGSTEET
jgi:S-adenosylmethionine/arginine decarboxylase-like enzyme|tara:strand:+ start:548 stop:961 length:414 start_codon:yes stop_codon:yes gene_type:complete